MREYRFRGKRLDGDKEWVYGSLIKKWNGTKDIYSIFDWPYEYEVDPEIVGQYTGMHDKTGKEGYEADILATPVGRAVIRFGEYSQPTGREKHVGFYLEFEYEDDNEVYRKDIGYWMPQSEIIGTLYDTPELLKEGNV